MIKQNHDSSEKFDEEDECEYEDLLLLKLYQQLNEINPDFVGWLCINNTTIDYPVMLSLAQEDYYLHRNFQKDYSYSGIPYISKRCNIFKPSPNIIIYSNHCKDGSTLGTFYEYANEEYYKMHKKLQFDTIYNLGVYEIISVFDLQKMGQNVGIEFYIDLKTKEEYDNYIRTVKKLSFYETGVTAVYGEPLITLAACEHSVDVIRMVIVAKKIH